MTFRQDSDNETPATVSLTITGLTVSSTNEQRIAFLSNLEDHVEKLLAVEFDQSTTNIEIQAGYQYATVCPTCPDCDEPLDFRDIHLGDSTDAFAFARCSDECGWTGDAVFKLVDLDG
jgi:hypothetical protein